MKFFSNLWKVNWLKNFYKSFSIYNRGSYSNEYYSGQKLILFTCKNYFLGVTIGRSITNQLVPNFLKSINGNLLEIGGVDDFPKKTYLNGKHTNINVVNGPTVDQLLSAENMDLFADNSFDGVFCMSVLEHTLNPQIAINEIYRCLKPGGRLLISLPWLFEGHMFPVDYYRFSINLVEKWLDEFDILQITYSNNSYYGLLAHIMQRNLVLRFTLGIVFLLLDFTTSPNPIWTTQIFYEVKKPQTSD